MDNKTLNKAKELEEKIKWLEQSIFILKWNTMITIEPGAGMSVPNNKNQHRSFSFEYVGEGRKNIKDPSGKHYEIYGDFIQALKKHFQDLLETYKKEPDTL